MRHFRNILMIGSALALVACGADDVASPGEGTLVPSTPAPSPSPSPSPTPTPTPGTPATGCATGFADAGTIGNYRICRIPASITADLTIPARAGTAYQINGRVDVGIDLGGAATPNTTGRAAILTIEPGALIFGNGGDADNDFLIVNRGSQIQAVGTEARPIIFTARENLTAGGVTDTSQGLWGGIILAGRAPISNCNATVTGGSAGCENTVEGTGNALYGGAVPADSSGRMQYVQIRYSGVAITPNNELQGLTTAGVGSGTTISHIQIHNSADDGIEVFGGRVNMKHLVITGAEDDGLDTDVGYQGNIQYVIGVQREGGAVGDSMMEIDSNGNEDASPRQRVAISNFTYIHRNNAAGNGVSILVRGGADYTFANGLIVAPGFRCLGFNSATTVQAAGAAADEQGPPVFRSVSMQCNASPFRGTNGVTDAQVQAIFDGGTNNRTAYTPSLTNLFVNGATETAFAPFDAKTLNAFFDTTAYVGAVRDANDTWYQGWTCNSTTANFGTSSRACSAIPTT